MPSPVRALLPRGGSSNLSTLKEEDPLFDAPTELVCPITHAVFLDPVLTQAGHAYERTAIEQHLRTTDTDPMSNQPLLNSSLTPVFVLKSRALEYREATSRLCVDRACSVSPPRPPIDYLRRAVELCSDAGFLPKGLTSDVVTYISSHLSNVYDRLALDLFARGLADNGYRDRAAAVYFYLLTTEEDKEAQADMLKRCITCWSSTTDEDNNSTNNSTTGKSGPFAKEVDGHVFEKLVQMIDTTGSQFGWIIEVSSGAGLGNTFIARFCEHILFPQRALIASSPSSPSGLLDTNGPGSSSSLVALSGPGSRSGGSSTKRQAGSLPWETEKEVLLKYCFVLASGMKEEHEELTSKLKYLEEKVLGRGDRLKRNGNLDKRGRRMGRWFHPSSNNNENDNNGGGGDGDGLDHPICTAISVLQRAVRHPFVMVPCAVLAAFGDPHNPLVRSTYVLPFLALMQNNNNSSGDGFGNFSGSGGRGSGSGRFSSSPVSPQSPISIERARAEGGCAGGSSDGSEDGK